MLTFVSRHLDSPRSVDDQMFADIRTLSMLFSSSWPATNVTDVATAAGNTGAAWNYGASDTNDFGRSASPTDHAWPGSFGVTDASGIALCPGTAGASCSG